MAADRAIALLERIGIALSFALFLTGCTLFADPGDYAQEGEDNDTFQPDTNAGRPICSEFCDKEMGTCADFPQYNDRQQCMDVCAGLPDGAPEDYNGNTVHCRLNHLDFAADDPATHCPHTSEGGGEVCAGEVPGPPPDCIAFCGSRAEQCGGVFPEDGSLCQSRCQGVPMHGDPGDLSNHSLQCRQTYLSLLETGAPKVLCEALPFEENLSQGCNDGPLPECQALCLLFDAFCPGRWDSRDACIEDCSRAQSSGFAETVDCSLYTLVEGPQMSSVIDYWDPNSCDATP